MFILGFVLPPFWLIGALLPPKGAAAEPLPAGREAGLKAETGWK
jgi:hypothetical protein